jgi:hypothetical protein
MELTPGGGTGPAGADVDGLLAALGRWAADERGAEAGRQRSRERWLRQQATGSATFTGVLTDLAEAGTEVVVTTTARAWSGAVVGVGRDFCVVEDRRGAGILVATAAVISVTAAPGGRRLGRPGEPSGERAAPLGLRLIDALGMLAGERNPVLLSLGIDHQVPGELIAVGSDVVTLRVERPPGTSTHIPLERIQACVIR